ncbi:DamX protein [Enterobacillus tribolii]|uniref:Cell division protein DamX n=2 Tax=Enterobacillus tribolii TaxID=1487935 RepID=A0A370QUT3_9GAMM|nr:DamX protein [Enterobacillus tribolii]
MDKMEDEDFSADDDLRPDASDRRASRSRKSRRPSVSVPKVTVSRQHLIMGIGILVLLLIIISIGSALKSPDQNSQPQQASGDNRNINLSGSSSLSGNASAPSATTDTNDGSGVNNSGLNGGQPQSLSGSPISSTPTQAPPMQQPENQQRVDLPGNLSDALSPPQAQNGMNNLTQSTLPTGPATLAGRTQGTVPAATTGQTTRPVQTQTTRPTATTHNKTPAKTGSEKNTSTGKTHTATTTRPAATASASTPARNTASKPGRAVAGSAASYKSAPGSHYTLQLSSASRSDTLNAFAKQQNLPNYLVYETTRDGKPWYVLVSGIYASPAEAKKAVSTLPAGVQAKQPWAKPLSQVQKEIK